MVELNERIKSIPMPARIKALPINSKGFPTPWFVEADATGSRDDLRIAGQRQFYWAVQRHLCWICGERLGIYLCFAVGPMCTINRISSEPPSHWECAEYAVRACPFLSQPAMRRNEKALPEHRITKGIMVERNPGVTALWVTKQYHVNIHRLVEMGEPKEVAWWAFGQPATRDQVIKSFDTGLPILRDLAQKDGPESELELETRLVEALKYLPLPSALTQDDWDNAREDKWRTNLAEPF